MSEQGLERVEVLRAEVAHEVARASSLVIASPADFTAAGEFLKAVKAAQNRVTAHFAGMKAAAHAAWKAVTTQEADTLKPLAEAEAVVKRRMLDYHAEQERIRIAEERRLQAEADERARREREALERKAAAMKTEAKREEYAERAAAVQAPVVTVAPTAPKVAGTSIKKTWKARLVSLTALTGIPAGDVRLSLIQFDQGAANRLAVATKGAVAVAGIEWYEGTSMAASGSR